MRSRLIRVSLLALTLFVAVGCGSDAKDGSRTKPTVQDAGPKESAVPKKIDVTGGGNAEEEKKSAKPNSNSN